MSANRLYVRSQRLQPRDLVAATLLAGLVALAGCVATAEDPEPAAAGQAQQAINAQLTCWNWASAGTGPLGGFNSVSAECSRIDGGSQRTTLWLPGCLANQNGGLVLAHDGFFDRSCAACAIDFRFGSGNPLFTCNCRANDGSFHPTSIPMSLFTNSNGNLVCDF